MKDYILNKNDKEKKAKYITKVKNESDGTLTLTFADGTVFKNIEANEENIAKITKRQEKQARDGIARITQFKNRLLFSEVVSGIVAFGTVVAAHETVITMNSMGSNSATVAVAVGTVTVLGVIPIVKMSLKPNAKVNELEKLAYREEHKEALDSFKEYENSLASIKPKKAQAFLTEENPFGILNVDSYTKSDLETIVTNIDREKAYQFTYKNADAKK